jgi:hypothetical protein
MTALAHFQPRAWTASTAVRLPSLTDSRTFPGITTTRIYAAVVAQNTGFASGSATVDGISALLTTTVVAVPAAAWLFGSGLLGLMSFARRKAG